MGCIAEGCCGPIAVQKSQVIPHFPDEELNSGVLTAIQI
jgi:hypothetical protein